MNDVAAKGDLEIDYIADKLSSYAVFVSVTQIADGSASPLTGS